MRIEWKEFSAAVKNKPFGVRNTNIQKTGELESKVRALEKDENLPNFGRLTRETFVTCYGHKYWQPSKGCLESVPSWPRRLSEH